jgi:hypothetical protein
MFHFFYFKKEKVNIINGGVSLSKILYRLKAIKNIKEFSLVCIMGGTNYVMMKV